MFKFLIVEAAARRCGRLCVRTQRWTQVASEAVKWKKEAFQLVLTEGFPDSLEMYKIAIWAVAIAFAEAKVQTLETIEGAMEKDD